MKKIKLVLAALSVLCFINSNINAQDDCFKLDNNSKRIELKGKIDVAGKTKNEILNTIIVWGSSKHSSQAGTQVIKDREAGVFKINLAINYNYKESFRTMTYALTMIAHDGFFEYIVNDLLINDKQLEEYLIEKVADPTYQSAFSDICKKIKYTLNELKTIN